MTDEEFNALAEEVAKVREEANALSIAMPGSSFGMFATSVLALFDKLQATLSQKEHDRI
jgi:hypothetical protein